MSLAVPQMSKGWRGDASNAESSPAGSTGGPRRRGAMRYELHLPLHRSLHRSKKRSPRAIIAITALTIGLTVGLSGSAFADDDPEDVGVEVARTRLTSATGTRLDILPKDEPNWFRANIRLAKKHGFEYSRSFSIKKRDTDIVFSVQGPMIHKETAGLAFEIRF